MTTVANQKALSLLAGFRINRETIKPIVIREMMDTEEELLGEKDKVLDLVSQCTTRIGEDIVDPVQIKAIYRQHCLYGDWEYVLFQIRMLTLGYDYEFNYICPNKDCLKENKNRSLDLRTVPIRPYLGPEERGWSYTSRSGAVLAFGEKMWSDSDAIGAIVGKKEKDVFGQLMALNLISVNGNPIVSDIWQDHVSQGAALLKKHLPEYQGREHVRQEMNRRARFGLDRNVLSKCEHCGTESTCQFTVDTSFLFPSMKQLAISQSA